jgi:hypothetical protein
MQGAAKGGHPMQATPNGVVEAGQRSRLAFAAFFHRVLILVAPGLKPPFVCLRKLLFQNDACIGRQTQFQRGWAI